MSSPCAWTTPTGSDQRTEKVTTRCEYVREPAPVVTVGDQVTVCTATHIWTVQHVTAAGVATLTSPDIWKAGTAYRVHRAHLQAVPGAQPDLLGLLRQEAPS